jgi:hypothetical protein
MSLLSTPLPNGRSMPLNFEGVYPLICCVIHYFFSKEWNMYSFAGKEFRALIEYDVTNNLVKYIYFQSNLVLLVTVSNGSE